MEHKKKKDVEKTKENYRQIGRKSRNKDLYQSPLLGHIVGGKYGSPLAQFGPVKQFILKYVISKM